MPDYQRMYNLLFNQITDVINELELIQEKTEDIYIKSNTKINYPASKILSIDSHKKEGS